MLKPTQVKMKCPLPKVVVHHPAKHLREPVVDAAKTRDDNGRHKGVVEMRDYKIAIVQIDI